MEEGFIYFKRNQLNELNSFQNEFIYLLIDNSKVVYVGQTTSIQKRIYAHTTSQKIFDSFAIKSTVSNSNNEESELIFRYSPKYNKSLPQNSRFINFDWLVRNDTLNGINLELLFIGRIPYIDSNKYPQLTFADPFAKYNYNERRSKKRIQRSMDT